MSFSFLTILLIKLISPIEFEFIYTSWYVLNLHTRAYLRDIGGSADIKVKECVSEQISSIFRGLGAAEEGFQQLSIVCLFVFVFMFACIFIALRRCFVNSSLSNLALSNPRPRRLISCQTNPFFSIF